MNSTRVLRCVPKLLRNREKVLFKDRKAAFADFWRVSAVSLLVRLGVAILLLEFGIPAPDVMYDLKKLISPDFAMFTRHGKIAEFDLRLSNQVKGIKFERELIHERMQQQKSPESKFGGAI